MEQIKNDQLTIEVNEHGAELSSIKDASGHEYLWQGDANYWPRRSPILFPIVCGLWSDTMRVGGHEYHMARHGFARDMDFHVIARGNGRVVMGLHDTVETRRVYPWRFNLAVGYRLDGNRLHVVWHVENTDDRPMHFQIGGHPAFNVPGAVAGKPLAATLRLDDPSPVRIYGNVEGCIDAARHDTVETDDGLWRVTEDTFAEDAVIFDHSQLHSIALLDADGAPEVTVDFRAPAVGVWTPAGKHAPFLCIEPWYGLADTAGYEGEFAERRMMNHLLPGSSFMSEYTITIK